MYIIKNKRNKKDYWSNFLGWTEYREEATVFDEEEIKRVCLPIDGKWVKKHRR